MNINLTHNELTSLITALDLAIQDKCDAAKYTTDAGDKADCENEAEALSGIQANILRQMSSKICVSVAVEVRGGLVQNIYSNGDVSAEVYDLDISDFPDDRQARPEVSGKAEAALPCSWRRSFAGKGKQHDYAG